MYLPGVSNRKPSRYTRDRCPTCGSDDGARRGNFYSTRRPGRHVHRGGAWRGFGYGRSGLPTKRIGRNWKIERQPGTTGMFHNHVVYVCNDRWHLRNQHDPASPLSPWYVGRPCDLPGHEAPARSVDTRTPEYRAERRKARTQRHKALQSKDRR